jgi:hypothetical protein
MLRQALGRKFAMGSGRQALAASRGVAGRGRRGAIMHAGIVFLMPSIGIKACAALSLTRILAGSRYAFYASKILDAFVGWKRPARAI